MTILACGQACSPRSLPAADVWHALICGSRPLLCMLCPCGILFRGCGTLSILVTDGGSPDASLHYADQVLLMGSELWGSTPPRHISGRVSWEACLWSIQWQGVEMTGFNCGWRSWPQGDRRLLEGAVQGWALVLGREVLLG